MEGLKVADLSIDEFKELVREIIVQTLSEVLNDPDLARFGRSSCTTCA